MRRALAPLLLIVLPLAAFLALFHPATLRIDNPGWLIRGTDNGENALGIHAWLHDPQPPLALRTTLLNAPEGVALLFTDSNPLVALAVKPFAPLLPADAQFVGPWVLLCFGLSALFAWLLLRRHAPGPLALWCGVVLLAFPPTLANRFIHTNLMAHWTILAALWLFLDPVRGRGLRWWAPLIAVTALIHSYLLVMVGAIWASSLLGRVGRDPRGQLLAAAGQGAAVLVLVAGIAWWLGVRGGYVPSDNYGAFAMPLDALWNPANPGFATLLPAIEQREGRGFEGFQYLGLGGLLLLGVALYALIGRSRPRAEAVVHARLRWLLPALAVLTVLAISHLPDVAGTKLPRLSLPQQVLESLDAVRASGRLFWPVGYTLILAALIAVYRLRREAGVVLAALLAIQAIDLAGMMEAIRGVSAEAASRRLFVRTVDPRWEGLLARSRSVAFMPADVTRDLLPFQEIAWRAARRGIPVTTVYAARTPRATTQRLAAEQSAFAAGRLVPGRLYVLLAGAPLPAGATPRMVTLDGITVIAP